MWPKLWFYLSCWFDPTDDEEENDDPCQQKTQRQSHMNTSILIYRRGDVQCLTIEEILCGWSHFTLLHISTPVTVHRTLGPRQHWLHHTNTQHQHLNTLNTVNTSIWTHLKWVEEIPEAPGIDDVVVETQVHWGHNTGDACDGQRET